MQQIAFEIGKKLNLTAALRGPGRIIEDHAARFQFGASGGKGRYTQGEMPKAGQLVVAAFRERGLGGVEFQPRAAGKFNETRQGLLAIVPDRPRAEDSFIPVFQGQRVGGGNRNVFEK